MRRGNYVVTWKEGRKRRERHPDPEEIEDLVAGRVSSARAKTLQQHVDDCLPCHTNFQRAMLNFELSKEDANHIASYHAGQR